MLKRKQGVDIFCDPAFRKSSQCDNYSKKMSLLCKTMTHFPLERINSAMVTMDWIIQRGFHEPFMADSSEILGMKLPSRSQKISDMAEMIGTSEPITVMEVGTQSEIMGCTIGDYAKYIEGRQSHHKTVNLISLEVSSTPLCTRIQGPKLARRLDWVDALWPLNRRAKGDYPRVQKYCLCGMKGAYTDFHLDFGGTSVWYNVVWGKKVFFLVRPTCDNLRKYEEWSRSSAQEAVFFGDLVSDGCYQVEILPGETLFLPGGWIHAVFTPEDSLVFGGNFLTTLSIVRQLQVYYIEERTRVAKKFRFPLFKATNWLMMCSLLQTLERRQQNWGREVVDNDDDSDDENEWVNEMADSFKRRQVILEFPFLIKSFELWFSIKSFAYEEMSSVDSFTTLCGCATKDEVLERWWLLIEKIADSFDDSNSSSEYTQSLLDHIQLIRSRTSLDLLDEECISTVNCFKITAKSTETSAETSTADLEAATVSVPTTVKVEDIENSSTDLESPGVKAGALVESPSSASKLVLRLRSATAQDHESLQSPESVGNAPAIHISSPMKPEDAMKPQKNLNLKLKVSSSTPVLKLHGIYPPEKVPKSIKMETADKPSQVVLSRPGGTTNVNNVKGAGALGRTRGHRVSADILEIATDIFVDREDNDQDAEQCTAPLEAESSRQSKRDRNHYTEDGSGSDDQFSCREEEDDDSGDDSGNEHYSSPDEESVAKRAKRPETIPRNVPKPKPKPPVSSTMHGLVGLSGTKSAAPKPKPKSSKLTVRQMLLKKCGGKY